MDRDDLLKLLTALALLAITLALGAAALNGIGSFSGGIRAVPPPTWYGRLLGHPAFYYGAGIAVLAGIIGWQLSVSRVTVGDLFNIEREEQVYSYWSILAAESAAAALLIHLALNAYAAS